MAVDRAVGSSGTRLLFMSLAAGFLLLAFVGWDVIGSQLAKAESQRQLDEQKQIAAELETVMKEQKELEARIAAIDARIAAIKKLRDEQKGPSSVLEAIRERLIMNPSLYLQSIEQKGGEVTIKGNSPDEAVVTQFGRSLEFSNGLFTNLNIETQRKEMTNQMASATGGAPAPMVNVVDFTIKAGYVPSKSADNTNATTASAAPAPGTPAQPQVAKN